MYYPGKTSASSRDDPSPVQKTKRVKQSGQLLTDMLALPPCEINRLTLKYYGKTRGRVKCTTVKASLQHTDHVVKQESSNYNLQNPRKKLESDKSRRASKHTNSNRLLNAGKWWHARALVAPDLCMGCDSQYATLNTWHEVQQGNSTWVPTWGLPLGASLTKSHPIWEYTQLWAQGCTCLSVPVCYPPEFF